MENFKSKPLTQEDINKRTAGYKEGGLAIKDLESLCPEIKSLSFEKQAYALGQLSTYMLEYVKIKARDDFDSDSKGKGFWKKTWMNVKKNWNLESRAGENLKEIAKEFPDELKNKLKEIVDTIKMIYTIEIDGKDIDIKMEGDNDSNRKSNHVEVFMDKFIGEIAPSGSKEGNRALSQKWR